MACNDNSEGNLVETAPHPQNPQWYVLHQWVHTHDHTWLVLNQPLATSLEHTNPSAAAGDVEVFHNKQTHDRAYSGPQLVHFVELHEAVPVAVVWQPVHDSYGIMQVQLLAVLFDLPSCSTSSPTLIVSTTGILLLFSAVLTASLLVHL